LWGSTDQRCNVVHHVMILCLMLHAACDSQGEEAISRRRERIQFVRKVVSRYERPLNNLPIEYKKTAERRSVSLANGCRFIHKSILVLFEKYFKFLSVPKMDAWIH
jgi:hypothetical protein